MFLNTVCVEWDVKLYSPIYEVAKRKKINRYENATFCIDLTINAKLTLSG